MDPPALWLVALNAFAAVIVLLTLLAGAIRLLSIAFPERTVPPPAPAPAVGAAERTLDAPTLAAIEGAVQRAVPGGRVVRIERTTGGPK